MSTAAKIKNREDFPKTIKQWQSEGKEIVFTNGCFFDTFFYFQNTGIKPTSADTSLNFSNKPIMAVFGRDKLRFRRLIL